MKKMIGFIALTSVTAIACAVGTQQENIESTGSSAAALDANNRLWGAERLGAVIPARWTAAGATAVSYQVNANNASLVAQESLRNGSAIASPTTSAGYQSLAPMSRDFSAASVCNGGGSPTGVCCANERSNKVGYGAVDVLVKTNQDVTNVSQVSGSSNFLKNLYFGNANGTAGTNPSGSYPTGCITSFTDTGGSFPKSGTGSARVLAPDFGTEANIQLRTFTGVSTTVTGARGHRDWCENVIRVSSVSGSLILNQSTGGTDANVTSTYVGPGLACASSDSVAVCIGKIINAATGSFAYLGVADRQSGGAIQTNNRLLNVDGVARGATTTVTNIRNLTYPLAYTLYLNENVTNSVDADEKLFYNALYTDTSGTGGTGGAGGAKSAFDTALSNAGLVPCDASLFLACGTGACSGKNDGRGIGACGSSITTYCTSGRP